MQYQVLARKWRPRNFHELVGQEHVSRTLYNALRSGRVAHAFLFSGPRGSGKTTMARILAKALNCHRGEPGEPCGECPACVEIAAGNCMDVLEIDAASNRGIDEIRDLREKVRYNPARDKKKVFIIDEVHMLTTEAFNALLKTLEEPPPHVVFIMATTEYHKIPATILSRCQQYSFRLIRFPLILDRLREIARAEQVRISDAALEQVAFSSGGSMRDAMSGLDQVIAFSGQEVRDEDVTMLLGLVEPKLLGDTVRAIASNDTDRILAVVGDLVETGQDLNNFCRRLLAHFRNLMVLKAGVRDPSILGVPESLLPDLSEQEQLFSREDLLRLFDAFLKIEADLKHATQVRFQLEMGLIELAQISRLRSLEDLIGDFTRLVEGGTKPAAAPAVPTRRPAPGRSDTVPVPERPRRKIVLDEEEKPPLESAPAQDRVPSPAAPAEPRPREERPVRSTPDAAREGGVDDGLLDGIASAVKKASLGAVLHSVKRAELKGNTVLLVFDRPNDFLEGQLNRDLDEISRAASSVVGRPVKVRLEETPAPVAPPRRRKPGEEDLLERARREPQVRSFLERFPGPVKAEKTKK